MSNMWLKNWCFLVFLVPKRREGVLWVNERSDDLEMGVELPNIPCGCDVSKRARHSHKKK